MNIYALIKPLGIITYTLVLITLISGLKGWKLKYHKILGITALLLATMHALLVITSN